MPRHSIHEYLGLPEAWPVVEKIKHEIILMPNAQDIKSAKRNDPRGCALHNAACRVYNVPNCAIGGRWAYIPQRNHKGKHYIARMQAAAETQRAIRLFDKTGKMPEGGFRFIPIAPSHLYEHKRRYMKKWVAGEVGHNSRKRGKLKSHVRHFRAIPRALTP